MERSDWFDEDGRRNVKESLRKRFGNTARGWEQWYPSYIRDSRRRKKFELFGPEEERAFGEMIKLMLVLEPGERATIEDVVVCEWMQRWGLPEVQRMWDTLGESGLERG